MTQDLIRNFCIVAHIDHGKSTLADRFLELTGTVEKRDMVEQTLDSNPISRERGITIKLAPVTMHYKIRSTKSEIRNNHQIQNSNDQNSFGFRDSNFEFANSEFTLNLIDTPGHVDFSYEVERSLAACEGAILLVDATQGVQAQTLAHFQKAVSLGLTIIPVVNKIDSPNAKVEQTVDELAQLVKLDKSQIGRISAKTGEGVPELLERVVREITPPSGKADSPPRALVFSSQYDPKRGVVAFVRIVDGQIKNDEKVYLLATQKEGAILELGHFTPEMKPSGGLETGEVGYVATNIKDPEAIRVGDTLTIFNSQFSILNSLSPLPGYRSPQPVVFVSFFPVDQDDFAYLEDGLRKLKLNDAAISFSPISSKALGRGFRCGFLGHLHAEVSQERLEKDFGLAILATSPTVEYKIRNSNIETRNNDQNSNPRNAKQNVSDFGFRASNFLGYEEPWARATIITPQEYVGAVMTLCEDRRGKLINMDYHGSHVTVHYELPLSEIVTDFFDQLKSRSSGYASMDYEVTDYRAFDAVRLDILINHEAIDAFSQIMEKSRAEKYGKFLVERLKETIPRQQIPIAIQAAVNGQIIAREDIPAFRKDVGAKLYGGDFTRRLKLEQKQKKGKEKMLALSRAEGKQIGKVSIPGDTFLKIFRT